MWDLPGPGLEPMSPTLAGGFLTTAPPGKPLELIFDIESLFLAEAGSFCNSKHLEEFIF